MFLKIRLPDELVTFEYLDETRCIVCAHEVNRSCFYTLVSLLELPDVACLEDLERAIVSNVDAQQTGNVHFITVSSEMEKAGLEYAEELLGQDAACIVRMIYLVMEWERLNNAATTPRITLDQIEHLITLSERMDSCGLVQVTTK